jgi:hypothetical protein
VVAAQTGSGAAPGVAALLHGYRWGLGAAALVAFLAAFLALAGMRSPARSAAPAQVRAERPSRVSQS